MHVCRLYQCVIAWVELNLGGEREGNRPISDVDKYWFSFKEFQRYRGRSFCLYVGSPVAHVAPFLLLSFTVPIPSIIYNLKLLSPVKYSDYLNEIHAPLVEL